MVVGVLGVLKAGGAYVPLDPGSPPERLSLVLEELQRDEGELNVLAPRHLASRLPEGRGRPVWLETEEASTEEVPSWTLDRGDALPENAAYVLYTSGSTGRPKGVVVEHRQLLSYLRGIEERMSLRAGGSFAMVQPLTVDSCKTALYPPLLSGGVLHLISEQRMLDPRALAAYFREHRIDGLKIAPSHLAALASDVAPGALLPGELLVIGGEASRCEWVKGLAAAGVCRVFNHYGPTETTVGVLTCSIEAGLVTGPSLTTPVGRPLPNVVVHVLDRALEPVPLGVAGELYVGGASVARGYLGRPDLTAERFVPDPWRPGERLYRTGDLMRHLASGALEFLGRTDQQVKIRGFRIEPAEVEAALVRCPGIREGIVTARDDGGGAQLVAYLVASAEAPPPTPPIDELRRLLRQSLPEPMVPSSFVFLAELPRTSHGKVDRQALPAPERSSERESAAPRTEVEEILAGIWCSLLGVERVGVEESFFELGGHSLLGIRLISRVREAFGVELAVRALFESPTLAALAGAVERELYRGVREQAPPIVPVPRDAPLPLSFAQERLWFLDQLEPGGVAYNIPAALRLVGSLDLPALRASLTEVVRRHESLRTKFERVDGSPVQRIEPAWEVSLPEVDLRGLASAAREQEMGRLATAEAARPFSLAAGPLLRAAVLRLTGGAGDGVGEWGALFTLHHIVSDAWSVEVLVRELATLYGAYRTGHPSLLLELPVQYVDFAVWQRQWLSGEILAAQISYWKDELSGAPTVLQLATDRPRPLVRTLYGAREPVRLGRELSAALQGLSRREGGTLFMTLLSGFAALLSRSSGQPDVLVGTAVANRTRLEIEGLIGFFVNTLVLRGRVAESKAFGELVGRTRQSCLGAYAHQDLPFERLVEELEVPRSLSHGPLFQVMFLLQHAPRGELSLPGLTLSPVELAGSTAKFDLTLSLTEVDGELRGGIEYSTDLFDGATVRRMAGHLEVLLRGAVADPARSPADLDLLSEGERHQLQVEWGDRAPEWTATAPSVTLQERFAAVAAAHPEAIAVRSAGEELTYRELARRADRLARRLVALGAAPDERIAVCLERSVETVVSILGVLLSGAAYLPLDPSHPAERLSQTLEDARPLALVTREPLLSRLSALALPVLCLDSCALEVFGEDSGEVLGAGVRALPENLAYVIYTSGSTGRPKGVEVTHASAVRLFASTDAGFGFGPHDVWTLFHSVAFDFSVWEIWGALLYGGRLVVVPQEVTRSPEEFHRLLAEERVTVLSQTPSAFRLLARVEAEGAGGRLDALRTVVFGGEALDIESVRPWLARYGDVRPRLVNMYGITETTVHVTWRTLGLADVDAGAAGVAAIGIPLPDLSVQLVDRSLSPVPLGVPGEILVGGAGVARGYLGRPELTAER
ncbi:MAG TPA: amino acid adenylation domain-containing protein, partial [Thermoanaerobaculia bacterium]